MTPHKKEFLPAISVIAPTVEFLQRVSGVDISQYPVYALDSNWDKYITDFEPQAGVYFDSMGCNIFSGTHGVESLVNAMGGDAYYAGDNGKCDLSERYLCKVAGVTQSGSSEEQWETAITTHGAVRQNEWPFPATQRTPVFDWNDFYAAIPPNVETDAQLFFNHFTPAVRGIGTDLASINDALKYAPVKIFIGTGAGFSQGEPNVIPATNNPMGHAVMVRYIDAQGIHILDQYAPYTKVLAPNYKIYFAFQTLLKRKGVSSMDLKNDNGTYYLVGDKGKLGIADPASLAKLKQLTSTELTGSTAGIPQVGIVSHDDAFTIHN